RAVVIDVGPTDADPDRLRALSLDDGVDRFACLLRAAFHDEPPVGCSGAATSAPPDEARPCAPDASPRAHDFSVFLCSLIRRIRRIERRPPADHRRASRTAPESIRISRAGASARTEVKMSKHEEQDHGGVSRRAFIGTAAAGAALVATDLTLKEAHA